MIFNYWKILSEQKGRTMKYITILTSIFAFITSATATVVSDAPGEVSNSSAQQMTELPTAPAEYSRPKDFKPELYKYNLKQLSEKYSDEMMARAQDVMRRVEETNANGKYKATAESIDSHKCPEWFKDAKFGIFIDWGLWSLASWAPKRVSGAMYPDWYELRMYSNFKKGSPFYRYRDYHVKNWGADFERDHFIPLFKAEQFDAKKLISIFKEAGAKYVVPFCKHHSGFCLWDSSWTFRDVMDMGPKRDITKEIVDACKKKDLKFGFYFSLAEWEYPILDDAGNMQSCVWVKPASYSPDMEYKASGKVAVKDYVRDYSIPQAVEFIDKYSPDILWYDADWAYKAKKFGSYDLSAYFYNVSKKPVAVNDRYGNGEPEEIKGKFTKRPRYWLRTIRGDFFTDEFGDTSECIDINNYHPWEACRGISQSFGNNWQDDESNVITSKEFVVMFADMVARGGNLLFLINLDGQGAIPEVQMKRLQDIGKWLSKWGECIYATRPLSPFTKDGVSYTQSKDAKTGYAIIANPTEEVILPISVVEKSNIRAVNSKRILKWEYADDLMTSVKVYLPSTMAGSELPVAIQFKIKK